MGAKACRDTRLDWQLEAHVPYSNGTTVRVMAKILRDCCAVPKVDRHVAAPTRLPRYAPTHAADVVNITDYPASWLGIAPAGAFGNYGELYARILAGSPALVLTDRARHSSIPVFRRLNRTMSTCAWLADVLAHMAEWLF